MKKLFQVDMNVKNMVGLAMFIALSVILGFVNRFLPEMPQGGTIAFDILPIFICAYMYGAGYGVICGLCVSILQFVLGLAKFYGPWSVVLDYALPLAVCGLAPLVKTVKVGSVDIYLGVAFSMVLKFLSHFASGAFLFASSAPAGQSPMMYSLVYNLPYNLMTMIVNMVLMSLIYKRLKR